MRSTHTPETRYHMLSSRADYERGDEKCARTLAERTASERLNLVLGPFINHMSKSHAHMKYRTQILNRFLKNRDPKSHTIGDFLSYFQLIYAANAVPSPPTALAPLFLPMSPLAHS